MAGWIRPDAAADGRAVFRGKVGALAAKPGNGYDEQTGLIFTEIPMERGQSLHIDLELKEGDKRYEIRSWYVYDSGEYEIDDTVKVWDGKDRSGT